MLDFPLERVIPCSLHLMMGITRKLLKEIALHVDRDQNHTTLITKMRDLFSSLKITLWSPKQPSISDSFVEVIKRSSLNRTQLLTVIENWRKIYEILTVYGKSERDVILVLN